VSFRPGKFKTEKQAGIAYNIKAGQIGKKCKLNNIIYTDQEYNDVLAILNNSKKRKGKSQYRGVNLNACGNWVAQIRKDRIEYCLGTFKSEKEAALAYNKKALSLYGASYKFFNKIQDVTSNI